jgi:hypothetical protein
VFASHVTVHVRFVFLFVDAVMEPEKKTVWKESPTCIPLPWNKDFSNFANWPALEGTSAQEKIAQFRAHEKAKRMFLSLLFLVLDLKLTP